MTNAVDVAVETQEGGCFQFPGVSEEALRIAVERAQADEVALSLVSTDSAAIVIPWKIVRRVTYVPVSADEEQESDAWLTLWERPTERAVG